MSEFIFEVRKEPHGAPQTVTGSWDDAFTATGLYVSPGHRNAVIAAAQQGGPSVDVLYGLPGASIKLIAQVIARIPVMA